MRTPAIPSLRSLASLWFLAFACSTTAAGDLSVTPLFDGERTGILGSTEFLNNWGGPFTFGNINGVARDTTVAHTGAGSIRANLGTINSTGFGFFQTFSSEPASQSLRQTRDMTRYESVQFFVRNDTGSELNLKYEVKDYRDNNSQLAYHTFSVPAGTGWTPLTVALDFNSPDWTVVGSPDYSRTYINSFVVTPKSGSVSGMIYLDDFTFRERGGPIDLQTAPIATIAGRLAERQFSGLWTARNRATGLIYNSSDDADLAAMNTTGGVLWMLPAAVRRGWVTQADADAFAGQVAESLNTNLNQTSGAQPRYVPTRFINPATAARPGGLNEESVIDASFIELGLHNYKLQPTTLPALASAIDAVENRFRLDAFAAAGGFRLAFLPASEFTAGTYDGYTNEGKVVSLAAEVAAEVSTAHHVPLEQYWNADTFRSRVSLVKEDDAHLAHNLSKYRAPFEQALLNLFVDTSDRGVDNYPVRSLATNPWENYVRYERETAAKLEQLDRDNFFQPDAGAGEVISTQTGPMTVYEQFSLYNNFERPTLFMPWSVSLALLAGAPGSEEALRLLLDNDLLQGPLGLADSARWMSTDSGPTNVPALQDNWNMVLSTMALLEYLDGETSSSRFFAKLPQVRGALDRVFVDGDIDGNGTTNAGDFTLWAAGFGDAAGATPAGGDADGDGAVDGVDFLRWQRGFGQSGAATPALRVVPEPQSWVAALCLAVLAWLRWRPSA